MYRPVLIYLFAFILTNTARAAGDCPLFGPVYPPPKQLSSSTACNAAKNTFSGTLDATILSATGSENSAFKADTTSWALQIFSARDSALYFNSTTLPRSVTKLWTVFLFLIEKGNAPFHEPVSQYVPELRAAAEEIQRNATEKEDPIDYVRWDEVTIGDLASHLAGISRQYAFGDLAFGASKLISVGFSQLPE
ncbi:hypothetical protein BBP40_002452 [Aspergillus hancockii]|nr:hypothetical protein BBP40_002452 [Aspergillus hancockii]